MSRTRLRILPVALCILSAVALSAPLSAQNGGVPTLRAAAVAFAPLPTLSLFSPHAMERIEQLARDDHWPMPTEMKPWPLDEHGKPIVETRQIDELWHIVRRYDTKRRLRQMYGGSYGRLQALNPGIDLNNLEAGDKLLVWQRDTEKVSQSVAEANRGRVVDSEPVPPGDNYVILYPHRSFGTYYAVSEIVRALDAFAVRFPEAPPVIVGDLSFRLGRRISPHNSHQSGRDVDITYPRRSEPRDYRRFHNISARDLDVERSLWLLKAFIDGGQIEYVFVDRYFQRLLIREAKRQGAPDAWIDAVFQYPKHSGTRAIVRHARGHRTHMHIRFKCQETDRSCR